MIAAWMLYGISVTMLVAGAAFIVERWLQGRGDAVRGVWLATLPISILLPLIAATLDMRGGKESGMVGEVASIEGAPELSGTIVSPSDGELVKIILEHLDPVLLALWVASSLALLVVAVVGSVRLRRAASGWVDASLSGRSVKVSDDVGPAVIGLARSRIVVPRWALELPDGEQEIIVAHEEEHIRAGDPQLLLTAFLFLVALPWNLPLWYIVHRLRLAIEIDCDRRVLARGVDVRAYGALLLDVSGQRSIGFAPAMANPAAFLERRIRVITQRGRRGSQMDPLLVAAFATLLLLVACGIDQPLVSSPEQEISTTLGDTVRGGRAPGPRRIVLPLSVFEEGRIQSSAPEPPSVNESVAPGALEIPPPPQVRTSAQSESAAGVDSSRIGEEPVFTPMEVRPELRNRADFIQRMSELYPPMLKDAAIGGTVNVWVFIDEAGQVGNTLVQESSGYPQLDATAEQLMREVADFSPAMNRDQNVPVWISIPVTFETRGQEL